MKRTCATLFAGGGLADVGLRAAGFTPVLAVEWDEAIAEAYALNHGPHVHVSPVEAFDYRPYAGVDLLWASPCCTNASVAKADAQEQTEDLMAAIGVCRALEEMRPRWFCLENVGGYRKFASFNRIAQRLEDLGYGVHWSVYDAADFGVPQNRRRLILRAVRGGHPEVLFPTHAKKPRNGSLFSAQLPWGGWYAAVEDLLDELPESRFAPWQMQCLEAAWERGDLGGDFLADGGNPNRPEPTLRLGADPALTVRCPNGASPTRAWLVDSQQTQVAPTREERRRRLSSQEAPAFCVPATGGAPPKALLIQGTSTLDTREGADPSPSVVATVQTKAAVPKALLVSNAKTEYGDGIPEAVAPAFTATGEAGGRLRALLEQGRVVAMNARALARFQSVPDSYRLPERNKIAYRVVGNGVPPLLSQRIAESLIDETRGGAGERGE